MLLKCFIMYFLCEKHFSSDKLNEIYKISCFLVHKYLSILKKFKIFFLFGLNTYITLFKAFLFQNDKL